MSSLTFGLVNDPLTRVVGENDDDAEETRAKREKR